MNRPTPSYESIHKWESYAAELPTEYRQAIEEGLEIAEYEALFNATFAMPKGDAKDRISDVLFDLVLNAPTREDYPYDEPSDLDGIRALCKPYPIQGALPDEDTLRDRIHGAWLGRVIGCLLGKPVEGIRTNELHPLLKASGNYPMHRYILSSDPTEEMYSSFKFKLQGRCFADTVDGMPVDDDTNYVVLAQKILDRYGRDLHLHGQLPNGRGCGYLRGDPWQAKYKAGIPEFLQLRFCPDCGYVRREKAYGVLGKIRHSRCRQLRWYHHRKR